MKRCLVCKTVYDAGACPKCEPNRGEATKADGGKAPIDLIPVTAIIGMADVFDFGGKKYGRHNFRGGFNHSRALNAALRHIFAIVNGEDLDPESGKPHVYHALCSLAMYDFMRLNHPKLDDRYKANV